MNLKSIAIISVCGNLALAGFLAHLLRQPAPPAVVLVETNAPLKVVERLVEIPVKVPEPFDWRKVESDDYRQYIANLRSVGCPETTVRDIIIADVNALFEARRRPLLKPHEDFKFWQADVTPIFSSAPARKIAEQFEQLRLLAEEKRAVLRELLGIDVPEKPQAAFAQLNPREQLLSFLPEHKLLRVEEIEQRFSALLMQRTPDSDGTERLSDYRKLMTEKRAELVKVLSAEELNEYDLRLSSTAVSLRASLGNLQPSEQEFREMVRIRQKFDEEFGDFLSFNPNEPGARERRAAAQRQIDDEMKRLLGPKRYEDYQRERDSAFQDAATVSERNGLPPGVAAGIYEMKRIAETEAGRVRTDPSLSDEERRATLDEVRLAVVDAVVKVLGREGYEAYQRQAGSTWLRKLNQEPVTSAAQR